MNDEEKAYIEWLANQDELRHNSDKRLEQAERELERLRAENAELRKQNTGLWQTLNITTDYADELHARLYAHAQHPGFPQPQLHKWHSGLPEDCPVCNDPDEPDMTNWTMRDVRDYISAHGLEPKGKEYPYSDDEPVAGTA